MDVEDASKNFFDFKVVDIAMGSGHSKFIDLIELEFEEEWSFCRTVKN